MLIDIDGAPLASVLEQCTANGAGAGAGAGACTGAASPPPLTLIVGNDVGIQPAVRELLLSPSFGPAVVGRCRLTL